MTEQPLEAEAVTVVDGDPIPEQTDNRPREDDGPQLPEDVALGAAPLPDELA